MTHAARHLLWLAFALIAAAGWSPALAADTAADAAGPVHLRLSSALGTVPSAAPPGLQTSDFSSPGSEHVPRPALHDYVRCLVGLLVYALYGAFAVSLAATPRRTRAQLVERVAVLVVLAGAGSLLTAQFLERWASGSAAMGLLAGFLVFFAAGAAYGYKRVAPVRSPPAAMPS